GRSAPPAMIASQLTLRAVRVNSIQSVSSRTPSCLAIIWASSIRKPGSGASRLDEGRAPGAAQMVYAARSRISFSVRAEAGQPAPGQPNAQEYAHAPNG